MTMIERDLVEVVVLVDAVVDEEEGVRTMILIAMTILWTKDEAVYSRVETQEEGILIGIEVEEDTDHLRD